MSNLVDMCTNGFAKLREKTRDAAEASGPSTPRAGHLEVQPGRAEAAAPVAYPGLTQALRIKPRQPATFCSDAALAMMVDCFSP